MLGATGRVGRPAVRAALERGHEVVAYVRRTADIAPREGLTVIRGDVRDIAALTEAAVDTDAAISMIASPSMRNGTLLQELTPSIVSALEAAAVQRFVFTSVIGAGLTYQLTSEFAKLMYRTVARPFLTDRGIAEAAVTHSHLSTVVAYLLNLTNQPRTAYQMVPIGDIGHIRGLPSFPYLSAADALIDAATDPVRPAERIVIAAPGQWTARR